MTVDIDELAKLHAEFVAADNPNTHTTSDYTKALHKFAICMKADLPRVLAALADGQRRVTELEEAIDAVVPDRCKSPSGYPSASFERPLNEAPDGFPPVGPEQERHSGISLATIEKALHDCYNKTDLSPKWVMNVIRHALRSAAVRGGDWQPIATANDYVTVLVYDRRIGIVMGSCRDGVWQLVGHDHEVALYPSHWMPLPETPIVQARRLASPDAVIGEALEQPTSESAASASTSERSAAVRGGETPTLDKKHFCVKCNIQLASGPLCHQCEQGFDWACAECGSPVAAGTPKAAEPSPSDAGREEEKR